VKVLFYYREGEQVGLGYISAFLKKYGGHKTDLIFDIGTDSKFGIINNPFKKKYSVNKKLIAKAKAFSPDLMAFSAEANMFPYVKEYAKAIKTELDIPVIIGGLHATALPEYVIKHDQFDILCRGEGEKPMLELCNKIEEGKDYSDVPSLWVKKKDGTIVKNEMGHLIEDINKLPFPDRDLFYKYNAFSNHLLIMGSRGCKFRCTYCHNSFQHDLYKGKGKWVRRRYVDNLIEEIQWARKKYPIKAIEFEDECFTDEHDWVFEFSKKYKEQVDLPFFCQNRPNHVTPEIAKALADAGCVETFMGVESGSKEIRDNVMHRYLSNEQAINAAKYIKESGIRLQATAIFGSPGETPEQMWETVKLLETIKPDSMPTFTMFPYPGSSLWTYAVENNLIKEEDIERVKAGEFGDHDRSVLKHEYGELAYNMSKMLSLYMRSPEFMRKIIKKRYMVNKRIWWANYVYLTTVLFDYPFYGKERIKLFAKQLYADLLGKENKVGEELEKDFLINTNPNKLLSGTR